PKKAEGITVPRKLDRPIDAADPVGDLIVRRAELFAAFKDGRLSQEDLQWTWDELRAQALAMLNSRDLSYYEKQDAYAQLLDFGVFTPEELGDKGVLLADYGISKPKQEESLQA
ncbi:MAG: hypothetical protein FJZ00_01725, partial [Candidatus Sericytochromatia bacterium]|nr:hypothetical protein [Candidatus Tanganyikabacteria bacterium]